jgi:glycosyltransferase involved in cell wall biosynthesis
MNHPYEIIMDDKDRSSQGSLPYQDSQRSSLLFVSQVLPFPPDTGVAVRTFNILKHLAATYDVTFIGFFRKRALPSPARVATSIAALEALPGVRRVVACAIPQEHSRARFLWDHMRSVAAGRPYTTYVYRSAPFKALLSDLCRKTSYDIIHVDSLDLVDYLPALDALRLVCVHHNVESKLLERRAAVEPSIVRRAYLRFQAARLRAAEREWCPRVALNVAVSQQDAEDLRAIAPGARFVVVPNGVDIREYEPSDVVGTSVAYLGGTEWFPNRDALDYFCERILPEIRRHSEQPKIRWIGRAGADEQEVFLRDHGIELTGYVPDVRPLLAEAACLIVPLRIGGGTRLKITTGMAMGKAIVSTSVGCEGLEVRHGEHILIRDDPTEFAAAVAELIHNTALRRRLGRAARNLAINRYSWDIIATNMITEYDRVARTGRGARAISPVD